MKEMEKNVDRSRSPDIHLSFDLLTLPDPLA